MNRLVIETPKADLVAGMKWFLGTYAARKRFNWRSEEGEDRAAIEGENGHDLQVDRRGVVDGGLDEVRRRNCFSRQNRRLVPPPWLTVSHRTLR